MYSFYALMFSADGITFHVDAVQPVLETDLVAELFHQTNPHLSVPELIQMVENQTVVVIPNAQRCYVTPFHHKVVKVVGE